MMNFPPKPWVDGQVFTQGVKSWKYTLSTDTWDMISVPEALAAAAAQSVVDAAAQKVLATTEKTAAQTARTGAETARTAAEAARDSVNTTGKVFVDPATGIAGTVNGQTFAVLDASLNFWVVYKNNAGAALEVSRTYTKAYIDTALPSAIYNPDVSFGITDASGGRSWLEVGPDGAPTQHARDMMFTPKTVDPVYGFSHVVTDQNDRVSYGVDLTGRFVVSKFSPATLSLIATGIGYALPAIPALLCAGDSLTAGAGGTPYTSGLDTDLGGRTVIQFGYGGQGTRSITARTGAHPVMVSITNNTIPAAGSVNVTARDGNLDLGVYAGSLCGVPGSMAVDGANAMVFTRTNAGEATACPPGTPFVTRPDLRGLQVVSWMGRNGGFADAASIASTINDTRLALDWAGAAAPKSLVLSVPPATTDTGAQLASIASLNDALRQNFPAQFVDVAARLRSSATLAREGIAATGQDLTDIAAGFTPTSIRSDAIHLNTAGYRAVRRIIAEELIARGATQ